MGDGLQVVVVSLLAAAALGVVMRPYVTRRRHASVGKPGCPSCASGDSCGTTAPEPAKPVALR